MIKNTLPVLVLTSALFTFGANAEEETWTCTYKGTETYAEHDNTTEDVEGAMTWVGSTPNWKIEVKTKEATITGTCDDHKCKFDEAITSGEHKGKTSYLEGSYSFTEEKDEHIDTFTGTWGHSSEDRKSGGTWEGKANCKSN